MNEYENIKKEFMRGWRTWNVRSVLSHVHMPDGLALNLGVKEYAEGFYLAEALIGRLPDESQNDHSRLDETVEPGPHAYDDSYTRLTLKWRDMEFIVESAVDEDDIYLLITPVKTQARPPMAVLEVGYLWNRPGYVRHGENGAAEAYGAANKTVRSAGMPAKPDALNINANTPYLTLSLAGRAAFYTGRERALDEIAAIVAKSRAALEESFAAYGGKAALYESAQCAIAWDTIYDPANDRVFSPVSRIWCIRNGGFCFFEWDNYFAGYLASFGDTFGGKALAYANVIEMTMERTSAGFVPNVVWGTGWVSEDRSEPPVGSLMVMEIYKKYQEKWLLELLYPYLLDWNRWYFERRSSEDGAFCWGSDPYQRKFDLKWETNGVNCHFGAALESGLDNSPMYDDAGFDTERHVMLQADVGLTSLFIADCRALLDMAGILSRKDDVYILEARLARARKGLERLWNDELGIYCNLRTDTGEFNPRLSPTSFYALFSPDVPKERAERVLREHYYNAEEFYGDWMLPSIARNDPAYPEQVYWRGRVWAPMNFLTYLAFRGAGLREACADLAAKSLALFSREWDEKRHIHENYNAETGEGCDRRNSDRFYHWGALLAVLDILEPEA